MARPDRSTAESTGAAPARSSGGRSFSEALRARDDEQLVALLRARPDLASPSPSTLRSLAARATGTASTERALAACTRLELQVLEAVAALTAAAALDGPPTADVVVAALAPADGVDPARLADAVRTALRALAERALLWSPDAPADVPDGPPARAAARGSARAGASSAVRLAPTVEALLGPFPAGLGPASGDRRSLAALRAAADDVPPAARAVLDALAWGPPVGVAPHDPRAVAAVGRLLDLGLVGEPDPDHVVLPAEVGLALRGGRTHRDVRPAPPAPPDARRHPLAAVDAEAAGAALEAVRLVADLVALWDDEPPTVLRTGGLAVRDLRRLALRLGTDDATAAAAAELALAAELVADDGDVPASFAPTTAVEPWLAADDAARWARLALAWFTSPRTPWVAATRDEQGAVRSALSPDHAAAWATRLRRDVLVALRAAGRAGAGAATTARTSAPTTARGTVPETARGAADDAPLALRPGDVHDVLAWNAPRNVPPAAAVDGILAGARLLGVVALDVLSTPGAALLGDAPAEGALAAALDAVLPAPVDDLLVQGDLTGIVPGRPSRDLAALLDLVASVESRGAALTVRFTAGSVDRALATGLDADDLVARLARHARGPLPQALDYLVRDAARRHGRVRVGAVLSYVRVDDAATVAGILADPALRALGLVRLAPTVVGAQVPAARVHEALAAAGVGAVLEGPDGRAVAAERDRRRVPVPSGRRSRARTPAPSAAPGAVEDARARRVVAELRARDALTGEAAPPPSSGLATAADGRAAPAGGGSDEPERRPRAARRGAAAGTSVPGDLLALLHDAIDERRLVELATVDGRGTPVTRTVRPLRLDGGRLRAVDPGRDAELTVAVHRIARVTPLDPS